MSEFNGQNKSGRKRTRQELDDEEDEATALVDDSVSCSSRSHTPSSPFDSSCDFLDDTPLLSTSPCQEMPLKLVKRDSDGKGNDKTKHSLLNPGDDINSNEVNDDNVDGDDYEENTANGDDFDDVDSEDESRLVIPSNDNQQLSHEQQHSLLSLMPELLASSAGLDLPSLLSRLQVTISLFLSLLHMT